MLYKRPCQEDEKTSYTLGENISKPSTHQRTSVQNMEKKKNLKIQEKKKPNRKWEKYMKRHFTKNNTWMTNKHIKRCSLSLDIREMHITAPMRYHNIPIKMEKLKNNDNTKRW